jgi:hypothetical protein
MLVAANQLTTDKLQSVLTLSSLAPKLQTFEPTANVSTPSE